MLENLFEEIESARTAASVNVVSGLRSFVRALNEVPAVRALAAEARGSETVASKVLGRVLVLSKLKIDTRYENPNDVAMAAYLQVLSLTARGLYAAATDAVGTAHNVWWALQLSQLGRLNQAGAEHRVAATITSVPPAPSIAWTANRDGDMAVVPLGVSFVPDAAFSVLLPSRVIVGQPLSVPTSESTVADGDVFRITRVNSPTVDRSVRAAA